MLNIRFFIIGLLALTGVVSADEFVRTRGPGYPQVYDLLQDQQIFFFGGVDAFKMYSQVVGRRDSYSPDVGVLYRTRNGVDGYDVAANTFGFSKGAEFSVTYNLYVPVRVLQPYLGIGGGVAGTYSGKAIGAVIPFVLGVNSPVMFADVGVLTYLSVQQEKHPPAYSWVVAYRPQARVGIGYQF